jgi:hypothetical protein
MVRVYSIANDVIDGSIIAAIISVHTPMNDRSPNPIVPGIAPMLLENATTPIPHPAAPRNNKADTGSPGRARDPVCDHAAAQPPDK